MDLLASRVPIEKALKDPALTDEQRRKLLLAEAAKEFAKTTLQLSGGKNYGTFVKLDRPYVSYVVSAAPKHKLEHHLWHYPFVGAMPYKGYFKEADAKEEEEYLKKQNLDTYMRGVSAYSTLGWFKDPILSSMLRYSDYDLVNTIIHELTHATLYIKHEADFNEQLATFAGDQGADLFYLQKEGADSPTLKKIRLENEDNQLFSKFISGETSELKKWYEANPKATEEQRAAQFELIKGNFEKKLKPQLQSDAYANFPKTNLNNARLMLYRTYMQDLSAFKKLYELSGSDFIKFIEAAKTLEKAKDPEKGLRELIQKFESEKKQ